MKLAPITYAFTDLMSTPRAFAITSGGFILAAATGAVLGFGDAYMTGVNLCISLYTMVLGQSVLVSTDRDSTAIHLKLDRIMEALDIDNDDIGAEHEDKDTLAARKADIEHRTGH